MLLLDKGANIEARDTTGETALIKAALGLKCTDAIMLLLDKGAQTEACDKIGQTALMRAAEDPKQTDAMMLLLNKGANIEARTYGGWTSLMTAVVNKNLSGVELLVQMGANIEARNSSDLAPYSLAVARGADDKSLEIARFLIGEGATVEGDIFAAVAGFLDKYPGTRIAV